MSIKREHGQFYTESNPFNLEPFQRWATQAGLPQKCLLEPFAGGNHIIHHLHDLGICGEFRAYDIMPNNKSVKQRDTIVDFPMGYDVCVTNPPWLARNSATRRGLLFPKCEYDDLYKYCLDLCLNNCGYVAALLPASYLNSRLFQGRLKTYILLHGEIFTDTENPVCLALFGRNKTSDVSIYYDKKRIGKISELQKNIPQKKYDKRVRFNDVNGDLGFISFDNTHKPSIHFCHAEEIKDYNIKESSRFITRISGDWNNIDTLIQRLNRMVNTFRNDTVDVFLTPFKGLRADGRYRRRMDFNTARRIINAA